MLLQMAGFPSYLSYKIHRLGIAVPVFKKPLFYLIMAPTYKSSDAGNSDMPRRSCKVIPLSENVKVLDLIKKEKKLYAEVAKTYGKNEPSIVETVKKKFMLVLLSHFKLQKLQPQ